MAEYGIKQTFPDKITDSSTTPLNGLGVIRWEGGNAYRYVLATDATVATNVVSWVANAVAGTNDFTVVVGSATVTAPAGVAIGTIAANSYGWIQVAGVVQCVGDGSVAALEAVVSNGDGTIDTMADGEEEQVIGTALEADVATTYYVQVKLRGLL